MTDTVPTAPTGYRVPARLLHWIVALLVLATIPAGAIMVEEGLNRSLQNTLFIFHKNIGVVILLLVLMRLVYRMMVKPPELPHTIPPAQRKIAAISHAGLYVMLLVMTISGYIRVRAGGFPIEYLDALGVPPLIGKNEALAETAKAVHFYARYVLILLILMHLGAATLHGLIKRDGIFSRMWPPFGR